ncbi:type I DNA topoisomerase [Rickettsiales bacterium]|nr:type I DNA topoisomerase [Rickettsiales bacterium]MDB2550683.1 type I DNA topoisomerase [Rickettsiales bacterium]
MKNLLIVESPAKAKTIGKYLGSDYVVLASFGHVRDLPSKNGSVDPKNNFAMNYQIADAAKKHISQIAKIAKNCEKIILAPDPDREGESIAWHVLEVLKEKKALKKTTQIQRVVFNTITKKSILEAIKNPRDIDNDLVDAQQARRALDYLFGFTLSPVLWRKLPGSRSAGRVQSVALRVICDRETEIELFKSQEYWDVKVDLGKEKETFIAALTHIGDQKLDKFFIQNEEKALNIAKNLEDKNYKVDSIIRKNTRRKPYPPFITSSLQQEASRKLGFSTKRTMQIAQKLYEGVAINGEVEGLITYMRTDGVYVDPEAISKARNYIKSKYGEQYMPEKPINYQQKSKNTQEAHEAIRPVNPQYAPKDIERFLDVDQFKLYNLIWKRMIASQMSDVIMDQLTAIIITNPDYGKLKTTGSVIKFDGFYVLYNEDKDDEEEEENNKKLPNLLENDQLKFLKVLPKQHFTEPPPRYSEASLVKKMEELGIGRPSTYSAIISVLQDRKYVKLEKKRFLPEQRGRIVTTFLKDFFPQYVAYDYTSDLEGELDVIAGGKLNWQKFLDNFWQKFHKNTDLILEKPIPEILDKLTESMGPTIFGFDDQGELKNNCPSCKDGKLGVKIGKFGVFIACSNYPECKHNEQIVKNDSDEAAQFGGPMFEPKSLGKSEEFKGEVFIKKGPYGFYLELVKDESLMTHEEKFTKTGKKRVIKPKRSTIPKDINVDDVDINLAKKLLTLPRIIGINPETNLEIKASIGPFGPYLLHDGVYISVKEDNILDIDLSRSLIVLKEGLEKKKNSKGRGFRKKTTKKKK